MRSFVIFQTFLQCIPLEMSDKTDKKQTQKGLGAE